MSNTIAVGTEVEASTHDCSCCRNRRAHGRVVEITETPLECETVYGVRWDDTGRIGWLEAKDLTPYEVAP